MYEYEDIEEIAHRYGNSSEDEKRIIEEELCEICIPLVHKIANKFKRVIATGAADEAGVGLRSPGRPHCSAAAQQFAKRVLPGGGVPRSDSAPTPSSPNCKRLGPGRVGKFYDQCRLARGSQLQTA